MRNVFPAVMRSPRTPRFAAAMTAALEWVVQGLALTARGLGLGMNVAAPVAVPDRRPFVDTQAVWKEIPTFSHVR
ncbi:MAG: hypothetical protein OEW27_11065 [Aquincola sp.]|nr:hypothetical protein [Aquincola sp.]